MTLRILEPTDRGLKAAERIRKTGEYPPEVMALKRKIAEEMKLGVFYMSQGLGVHPAHVQYIVDLRFQLDGLYGQILEGG